MRRPAPKVIHAFHAAMLSLVVGACSLTDPAEVVLEDFAIQTDSAQYRLRHEPGVYTLTLRVLVTNPLDRTVFLHRECGYGEDPSRYLVRADGDSTRVRLLRGVCVTQPMRRPIRLESGETYVDQVVLHSTESPSADPPITMDMRTGTFVLVYDIQLTNAVGGWEPADPLPAERTMSNPFVVVAPDDPRQ